MPPRLHRGDRGTAGDPVGAQYLSTVGYPVLTDPNVAALAANAKAMIAGDWSRYFVRMAGPLRFERSDEYAFGSDLITFRLLARADARLINVDAIKYLAMAAA